MLQEAHTCQWRDGKDHTWNTAIIRRILVTFQEIPGHDTPLHRSDRCQGEAAAGHRISSGIDSRVGDTLQIVVDGDTCPLTGHASGFQVEVINLWYPPGGMHNQVGFDSVLLRACSRVNEQVILLPLNRYHGPLDMNLDAQFLGGLYEQCNEIGIELFEGTIATMEYLYLCTRAGRNVCKLEGDVATTDEDDAARECV